MQIHHILLILWFIVVILWLVNFLRYKRNIRP
jgi:tellurite resistance protein TehA-like permease